MRLIDADAITDEQICQYLGSGFCDCAPDIRDLIDDQPAVDEWISVEDGLPSEEGYYFVWAPGYFGKNRVIGDIAYSNFKPNYKEPWAIKRGCGYSGGWTITHWMPLPEPLKEGLE